MISNRSNRALRSAVGVGVLACCAAVAQAEQVMPERFALLEQQQVAQVCAAAMNLRGDQAVRNEDSTDGERRTGAAAVHVRAPRVVLDTNVEDASLDRWARSFSGRKRGRSQRAVELLLRCRASRVDAMPVIHDVLRLRAESHGSAQ
jgi:hypothetical protein